MALPGLNATWSERGPELMCRRALVTSNHWPSISFRALLSIFNLKGSQPLCTWQTALLGNDVFLLGTLDRTYMHDRCKQDQSPGFWPYTGSYMMTINCGRRYLRKIVGIGAQLITIKLHWIGAASMRLGIHLDAEVWLYGEVTVGMVDAGIDLIRYLTGNFHFMQLLERGQAIPRLIQLLHVCSTSATSKRFFDLLPLNNFLFTILGTYNSPSWIRTPVSRRYLEFSIARQLV